MCQLRSATAEQCRAKLLPMLWPACITCFTACPLAGLYNADEGRLLYESIRLLEKPGHIAKSFLPRMTISCLWVEPVALCFLWPRDTLACVSTKCSWAVSGYACLPTMLTVFFLDFSLGDAYRPSETAVSYISLSS